MSERTVAGGPVSEPVRTCVGCRKQASKATLMRLVVDTESGELVVDADATMPGRGAYLHDQASCLQLAVRRRAFSRALRRTGEVLLSPDLQARFN